MIRIIEIKRLCFFAFLFSGLPSMYAQNAVNSLQSKDRAIPSDFLGNGRITGIIIDSLTRSPVEFANIVILDPITKNPLNGTVCDDKGKFVVSKIAKGSYQMLITFIGYETKKIPVTIYDKENEIDLKIIILRPSVKTLKEVVVLGQKELIEEKVDRTVYNAENDQTTKGGDATDVLKRVPMLTVDMDGNVSIRGNQGVKVLINNKPSTITSSSVADALKQIPSDMIKSVEVITAPSSKYDAEGSAGIINIILKKNTLEGKFFTVEGSAGSRGSNLSLNTNYRKGKMGFSLGGFNRATYNVRSRFANRQHTSSSDTTYVQSANTHSDGFNSQYTFEWDYAINKHNSITASARYGHRNQNSFQDQLTTDRYLMDDLKASRLQNAKTVNMANNVDASMTYIKSFTKKDREFNFIGIFSRSNQNNNFVTNTMSSLDNSIATRYRNENQGYTQEITFQEDFQEPVKENQLLEFGAKQIYRTVVSDYQYFIADGPDGGYSPFNALTNGFNYKQNITSGYFSYTLTALKNYVVKGGGRYEYTYINAHFKGQSDISIPSYGVLVPSVNISRKLKNGNLIKAAYNRRIQRPSLRDLNPNLQASNSLNATMGNPHLKPEYTDIYELSYKTFIKNNSINFSTYIRNNTNDIQQARSVRNDTIIAIFQNIGTETNYGLSIFATLNITPNFSVTGGTDMYYRILKNNSNDPFINGSNRGLVRNYRLFGNYNFSKGWVIQFFSFFQGKSINLQGYQTNPISHSISMKKDLWNKNGSVGFGIDNFATPSYKVHGVLNSAYLSQSTTNTLYNFIFKVNFSYKIGKLQENEHKKALTEEDN